jgi:hypothetical protein
MKLNVNTQAYDGVVSDNGYANDDTYNDGHGTFDYGWKPGDALPTIATSALGRSYVKGMGNAFTRSNVGLFGLASLGNTSYTDQEGNIVTQDDSGNLIAVVGSSASAYAGSSSTAVLVDQNGNVIQAGTQAGPASAPTFVPPDTQSPSLPSGVPAASWLDALSSAAPKILAGLNAYQISQINIDRARRGLPAINAAAYGPQIGVGLNLGSSNLLLYGALAIGAMMLIKK